MTWQMNVWNISKYLKSRKIKQTIRKISVYKLKIHFNASLRTCALDRTESSTLVAIMLYEIHYCK